MAEEKRNSGGAPERASSSQRRRRRRRSSGAKAASAVLYVLIVIGVSAVLATVGWTWANDLLALNKEYSSTVIELPESIFQYQEVTDENGDTTTVSTADMDYVADELKEAGLIEYKFLFKIFCWVSNADEKVTAGSYELDTDMDYRGLVDNMSDSSSTRQTVDVTIPEGYTIDQIFALLEEQGVSTVEKLQEMAADWPYKWEWLPDIPLGDYHRLEGYLFPDTYTFYLGENPKYVLNKMLNNFDNKMEDYLDQFTEESTYSLHDIVTIASMIQKETDGQDYGTIASVIFNRLENTLAETAGFLQIDATLVYINGGKVPTEADKGIDSPYNTYLYPGLPAGPISNPGMEALLAAMDPEDTNYYYYVLNPETSRHEFTRTYSEHQALVQKYASQRVNRSCSPQRGIWSGWRWPWPMVRTQCIWRGIPLECGPLRATSTGRVWPMRWSWPMERASRSTSPAIPWPATPRWTACPNIWSIWITSARTR